MPTPAWLKPLYRPESISFGALVTLTNVGASYDAITASRGLGCALVDLTNVTSIQFRVMVNKVGTGNQDWQLWNETDGAEIALVTDSGAAGNKTLSVTVNNLNINGLKLLRVRTRSSVAADDPFYYGATISLS